MADELWVSAVALLVSGASAAVAVSSAYRAERARRDAEFAGLAAFRTAMRRKTVLMAAEIPSVFIVTRVHESVYELREDLAGRIGSLPRAAFPAAELGVEACRDLLAQLRRWTEDPAAQGRTLSELPEARAAVAVWAAAMNAYLAQLDAADGTRRRPPTPRT
jgi:hypothetical protein